MNRRENNEDIAKIKFSRKTYSLVTMFIVLAGALLLMSYATFVQPLAHNALFLLNTNDGSWDISFTDMQKVEVAGYAREISKPDYTSTKASFYVSVSGPGDKITYKLNVKNSGTLDAVVDSIYLVPENQEGDMILYSISGVSVGDSLDAGEEKEVRVTAMYNPGKITSTIKSKNVSVVINYKQK